MAKTRDFCMSSTLGPEQPSSFWRTGGAGMVSSWSWCHAQRVCCAARPINRLQAQTASVTAALKLSRVVQAPSLSLHSKLFQRPQPSTRAGYGNMQVAMLSLGLVLLCCLQAYAEVPVQPDFHDDKIVGKWYSIGMASNSRWFQSKKQLLTQCTTIITPTADGALEVTSTYSKSDRCETKSMTFSKTEQPGRFRATSPRWGSEHDIRIVSTNYDEYALVYNRKAKGTEFFTMVTLYGRKKNMRPELLEEFKRFSLEQGLPQSSIITLPQTDKCMTDA